MKALDRRRAVDKIAATKDTSSIFATKNFAVFRFCPGATCMGFEIDDWCDNESLGVEYCDVQRKKRVWNEQAEMHYKEYDTETYGEEYCAMVERQEEWEKVQVEEQVLYDRRCQENYGEYMIELEEYLSLMLEYQMERFENYCEYCAAMSTTATRMTATTTTSKMKTPQAK